MSVSVQVKFAPADPRSILVEVEGQLKNRTGLHKVLAAALADQLQGHFRDKNRVPNRMNAPKTNFWNQVANATSVTEVSETGAVVTVAEDRFRIQLFGGTITPKKAKALTIPLIKEARGLFARSYETKFRTRLFTIKGKRALFERVGQGGEALDRQTNVRVRQGKRTLTIPLAGGSRIRPVYALVPKATIKADPTALPSQAEIVKRLQEEAEDFLARDNKKAGLA